MKNSEKKRLKMWKLVPIVMIFLAIMLFPAIASSAKVDLKIDKQEDSLKFVVKNIGKESTYVLNSLTIINDKGKSIYISHDPSSAEILRISQGKSYSFGWNIENIPNGK